MNWKVITSQNHVNLDAVALTDQKSNAEMALTMAPIAANASLAQRDVHTIDHAND